jgi:hypothetical protein
VVWLLTRAASVTIPPEASDGDLGCVAWRRQYSGVNCKSDTGSGYSWSDSGTAYGLNEFRLLPTSAHVPGLSDGTMLFVASPYCPPERGVQFPKCFSCAFHNISQSEMSAYEHLRVFYK